MAGRAGRYRSVEIDAKASSVLSTASTARPAGAAWVSAGAIAVLVRASAADGGEKLRGVALALDRDLRRCMLDLRQIGRI